MSDEARQWADAWLARLVRNAREQNSRELLVMANELFTLRTRAEQAEARYKKSQAATNDLIQCCGCKGWFPYGYMLPATPHPDADAICGTCVELEKQNTRLAAIVPAARRWVPDREMFGESEAWSGAWQAIDAIDRERAALAEQEETK